MGIFYLYTRSKDKDIIEDYIEHLKRLYPSIRVMDYGFKRGIKFYGRIELHKDDLIAICREHRHSHSYCLALWEFMKAYINRTVERATVILGSNFVVLRDRHKAKTVGFRIDLEDYNKLMDIAKARGITISNLLRDIVEEYINSLNK